jgi:hypothetical protein
MRRKSGRPPRGLRSIEESSEQTDKAAHLQQPRRVQQRDVFDTPGGDGGPDHGSNTTTTTTTAAAYCTKILKSSTPKQSMYSSLLTFTLSRVSCQSPCCMSSKLYLRSSSASEPNSAIFAPPVADHLPLCACVCLSLYIARLQGLSFIIGHFLSGDGVCPAKA